MAFSAFGTWVAKYNSALPTLTDGTFAYLQTTVNGELLVKLNAALPTGGNAIGSITNLFALDATLAKLTIAQGAALGANTLAMVGGSVLTAAPTYTTGQISPLSLDTAGNLRVITPSTGSTVSWGTATTTAGTITTSSSAITTGTVTQYASFLVSVSGTYAGVNFGFFASDDAGTTYYPIQAVRLDSFIAETTTGVLGANQSRMWMVTVGGATNFRVLASAYTSGTANVRITPTTSPSDQAITVGGTVAATQSGTWTVQPGNTANTTPWLATIAQGGNSAIVSAGGALKVDGSAVTQPVSGTVTANAGTNLNTSLLALDSTLAKLTIAQGAAIGANTLALVGGSVTTAAPTFTTGNLNQLSLTTAGALRADINSIASTTVLTGNGVTGAGSQRVTIASDNTAFSVNAVQSGTWNVTNAGTFAVQDSQVIVDNAAFTDGTSKLFTSGFIFDEVAGTALTENDAAAGRIDSKRAIVFALEDATTRGQRAAVSATGAVKVDGSAVTQPVSAASLPLPTGAATEATLAKLPIAQAAALGANSGPMIQGSVTTSPPAYTNGNINPLSLTTGGALRVDASIGTINVDKVYEPGTIADTTSNSGTGTLVSIATGSFTDLATLAVGAGLTAFTVGLTFSADQECQVEFVEFNGTTVTTWYRSFIAGGAVPTVNLTFPAAIKKIGSATHTIKVRAQALQTAANGMASINVYTR